jgi:hypothetical protein
MRRLVAICATGAGLALIVFTFTSSAFLRTGTGLVVLDQMRPYTTPQGFSGFHDTYVETTTGVKELTSKAYSRFAQDFGLTGPQFDAYVKANFSDVARGVDTVNALPGLVNPIVDHASALPHGFSSVYDLPTSWLPLVSVPWLLLVPGLALVLLGLGIWRLGGRLVTAVALVAGLAMIVVPLAADLPAKTSGTEKIIQIAFLGLNPTAATRSEQAAYYADDMVRQLNVELLPAVAARRHVSQAALAEQLKTEAPAFAKLLADWPKIAPGTLAFAAAIRAGGSHAIEAAKFPFEETPWLVISLGGLLALVASFSLTAEARRRRA